MDTKDGGLSYSDQHESAAEIARKKVLAVYSSTLESLKQNPTSSTDPFTTRRDGNQYITPPVPGIVYSDQDEFDVLNDDSDVAGNDYEQINFETEQSYPGSNDNSYQASNINSYPASSNQSSAGDTTAQNTEAYNQQTYQNYQNYTEPATATTVATPTPATDTGMLKDTPINQTAVNDEWQQYHSAWQNYYQNYYNDYYSKAAQNYLATEKLKSERIATGKVQKKRRTRRLMPIFILLTGAFIFLFLQYNRLIFAPIMAYVSPNTDAVATSIEAVNPTITQAVSPEPRLIIPKLNIDVPVAFGIPTSDVNEAMNHGVAQFMIPGANAMPGQVGNLVLSGHSAGDIYSSNPYKFIFSGLERLENGDLMYVNYNSVRYTYQMVKREVVEPSDVAALIYTTDKPMLTLITCTPLGTSRYRLLITGEQISPDYEHSDNVTVDDPSLTTPSGTEMPANEPSFLENIWNGIFGG